MAAPVDKLVKIVTIAGEVSDRLEQAATLNVVNTEGLVISTEAQEKRKKCIKVIGVIGSLLFSVGSFVVVLVNYISPNVVQAITNSTQV
jgi:hypothetical protein